MHLWHVHRDGFPRCEVEEPRDRHALTHHHHARRRPRLRPPPPRARAPPRLAHHQGLDPLRHLQPPHRASRPTRREQPPQTPLLHRTGRPLHRAQALYAEEAQRRQETTRFGADTGAPSAGVNGSGDSTGTITQHARVNRPGSDGGSGVANWSPAKTRPAPDCMTSVPRRWSDVRALNQTRSSILIALFGMKEPRETTNNLVRRGFQDGA